MEESDKKPKRQEIFSRTVRAGKRTYFFDVKSTRSGEYYLTITESKRRFNNEQGKFYYEKHKVFLYKEDFEKFTNGMKDTIYFIQNGKPPEGEAVEEKQTEEKIKKPEKAEQEHENPVSKVEFEDLDKETKKETEEVKTESKTDKEKPEAKSGEKKPEDKSGKEEFEDKKSNQ